MAQNTKSGGRTSSSSKSKNGSTSAKKKSTSSKQQDARPVRREVGAIVCLFLGLFSVIGYFNVDAWFINIFCGFIKSLIGWGYFIFPPALLCCAFILGFHRGRPVALRVTLALLAPVFFGAFTYLFTNNYYSGFKALVSMLYRDGGEMKPGGVISGLLSEGLRRAVSVYGAAPMLLVATLVSVVIALRLNPRKAVQAYRERPKLEYEPEPEPEPQQITEPKPETKRKKRRAVIDIPLDDPAEPAAAKAPEVGIQNNTAKAGFFDSTPGVKTPAELLFEEDAVRPDPEIAAPARASAAPRIVPIDVPASEITENVAPVSLERAAEIAGVSIESTIEEKPKISPTIGEKPKKQEVIEEREEIARTIDEAMLEPGEEYSFPPAELLKKPVQSTVDGREEIALNRDRLESTIRSFGVSASIVGVTRGPTITRYDLELEAGVKLTKLTNLAGDLALSLGVSNVRIAPIPDKSSTVGVEVPNKLVSTVYLRELIESDAFKAAKSKLSFSVGKDISGNCIVGNISKLPHMLIAGTTGSGKSVCMNCLILSLIYKAAPDEVRLIMIDPKMVELGIYNGIPHLYIPVVTDPKKAAGALQWAVVEMLKRYRLFSEVGVRELSAYNEHQKKQDEPALPQVVIVIDELADLMLVASKEVEESICRVAQMGRAAGMHLIIATQRPSADVITGLMKANIPSRIAFAVSSAMESRIILDSAGAEKLIGMGDMLYAPLGMGKPMRVQGAFVTDEEREDVINFIKQSSAANYSDEILAEIEKAAEDKGGSASSSDKGGRNDDAPFSEYDELLPQAVDVIFETKQASVSMLQRRLKLGYSRAARLVDQLEEIGVVGPFEGSKPRQILLAKEQWQEMQYSNGTAPIETEAPAVDFADYEDVPQDEWGEE